jgi:hypothetical protein
LEPSPPLAAEHGGLKRHLVDRFDADANARCGQRIGGPAGRKIGGKERRPADAVVDEVRRDLALQELAVRRHQAGAHRQAIVEGVLLVPERIEPRDRSRLEIGDRENVAKVGRTEKRPVGHEAVDVKPASLQPHELLQIDIELWLEDPDPDGAGPDAAAHIGEEIVGVREREGEALALEIGPQSPPIAAQIRRGRFLRFV